MGAMGKRPNALRERLSARCNEGKSTHTSQANPPESAVRVAGGTCWSAAFHAEKSDTKATVTDHSAGSKSCLARAARLQNQKFT